jgi:SH3 domain protein
MTLCLAGLLLSSNGLAENFYVSDTTLETILRAGPNTNRRIIASLPVGTRVTLIKEEAGWAEVSLPDGRTGWTLMRYLSDRPPWRVTAEKLAAEKRRIEKEITNLEGGNRALSERNIKLEKQLQINRQELEALRQEYEALKKGAANYIGLKKAFEKLQLEVPQIKTRLEESQNSHDELQSSSSIRWFLTGAGVLVLGWILGLIMSGRRRRSSEIYR